MDMFGGCWSVIEDSSLVISNNVISSKFSSSSLISGSGWSIFSRYFNSVSVEFKPRLLATVLCKINKSFGNFEAFFESKYSDKIRFNFLIGKFNLGYLFHHSWKMVTFTEIEFREILMPSSRKCIFFLLTDAVSFINCKNFVSTAAMMEKFCSGNSSRIWATRS